VQQRSWVVPPVEEEKFDIPDKINISEAEIRQKIMQATNAI
jgi:hypothetical protein